MSRIPVSFLIAGFLSGGLMTGGLVDSPVQAHAQDDRARIAPDAKWWFGRTVEHELARASDIYSALANQDPRLGKNAECVLIAPGWTQDTATPATTRAVGICRKGPDRWGAPVFYHLTRAGSSAPTDRIVLFRGAEARRLLLSPTSRSLEAPDSQVLERGEEGFSVVSNRGLTLDLDEAYNRQLYGSELTPAAVLGGELGIEVPKAARDFSQTLR